MLNYYDALKTTIQRGEYLLDRELNKVAMFLRNANGTFDITPIEEE